MYGYVGWKGEGLGQLIVLQKQAKPSHIVGARCRVASRVFIRSPEATNRHDASKGTDLTSQRGQAVWNRGAGKKLPRARS